jgi:hypothetical protein
MLAVLAALALAQDQDPAGASPFPRDTFGSFTVIFPTTLAGEMLALDNGVGARFDIDRDLRTSTSFAFDLNVHWGIEPEGGALILNFAGIWIDGRATLAVPTSYGGDMYAAGSTIETRGNWMWYEVGYAMQGFAAEGALQLYLGPTVAASWIGVKQTAEEFGLFTLLIGLRGGAIFRPVPFLAFGVEGGAWIGGMAWDVVDCRATCDDRDHKEYRASAWSAMVSVWASLDVLENVTLRVGYYFRTAHTSSTVDRHTHFLGAPDVPGLREDRDVTLRYGGPAVSVEIHY